MKNKFLFKFEGNYRVVSIQASDGRHIWKENKRGGEKGMYREQVHILNDETIRKWSEEKFLSY